MSSWLQRHERLLLGILALGVISFLGYQHIQKQYDVDKTTATATALILGKQEQTNQALQEQYDSLKTSTASQNAQLQQQNLTLAQTAANAYKAALAQQTLDQQSTNKQLAARIGTLTDQTGIQDNSNGLVFTHEQAATTTEELEKIPELKAESEADKQMISNLETGNRNLTNEVTVCNNVNTGLQKQIIDTNTDCKAQTDLLKAEVKKEKIANIVTKAKWGGGGFLVGFFTGVLAHII